MPLQPNISLGFQPARIQRPAPANPLAMAGQAMALKNAMTQGKLAEAKLAKAGKPAQFKTMEEAAGSIRTGAQFILDSKAANIAAGMPEQRADVIAQGQHQEFRQAFIGKGGGQSVLPEKFSHDLYSSYAGAEQKRKEKPVSASEAATASKNVLWQKYSAGGKLTKPEQQRIGVWDDAKSATPTQLSKLIAERDALAPNDPNRAFYDSKLAGSKGIIISPDGTITIGGSADSLTKATKTDLEKKLANIDVTMEGLDLLESTVDALPDMAFEILPRGLSTLKDIGTKIGRPMTTAEEKFESQLTDYSAKAGRYFDAYRKVVTGAQAGMRELAMLQRRVPVGEGMFTFDSRVDAKAKILANRQFDTAIRGRLKRILKDGFTIIKNEEGEFLGRKDGRVVDLTYKYPLKVTDAGFDGFEVESPSLKSKYGLE